MSEPPSQTTPIEAMEAHVTELRSALREVMIGGNHLATHIDSNGPSHRASPSEGLAYYGPSVMYDLWCCWRTIMRARSALEPEHDD